MFHCINCLFIKDKTMKINNKVPFNAYFICHKKESVPC